MVMEISKKTQDRIRYWILNDSVTNFIKVAMMSDEIDLQNYAAEDTAAMLEVKHILQGYSYSGQRIINEMEKNHQLSYKDALLHLNVNELLRNIYVL
jgi:hypothetical protein